MKKILTRTVLGILALLLIWTLVVSLRFWFAPRLTSQEIAGFALPDQAEFIEHQGGSNNLYYRWSLPYEQTTKLIFPDGRRQLFDKPTDWHPYDGSFFGSLTEEDVPDDGEAMYYRTDFWDVMLIRSRSENLLIIGGIDTN